jgi:hypothetical protein
MANKQIIPYGADLNKKPEEALALSVVPLRGIAPVSLNQSYFAQAIHHPVIAPPPSRLLLEDKPCQRETVFGHLDAPKLIKVPKEINLLPPRLNETLMGVRTNKFGDVTCAKYKLVTPRVTIDGVWAAPEQVKVVPPKEKKKRAPPAS